MTLPKCRLSWERFLHGKWVYFEIVTEYRGDNIFDYVEDMAAVPCDGFLPPLQALWDNVKLIRLES